MHFNQQPTTEQRGYPGAESGPKEGDRPLKGRAGGREKLQRKNIWSCVQVFRKLIVDLKKKSLTIDLTKQEIQTITE